MIKALMVITMVSGDVYHAKLPDMKVCYEQKPLVVQQIDVKSAACLPRTEKEGLDPDKLKNFFKMFQSIINELEPKTNNCTLDEDINRPGFLWEPRSECG